MARISAKDAGGANVVAFLDMLAYSEIGPVMLKDPQTDDGYRVLVGSLPSKMILMKDYADHPNIYNQATDSTAAGRYQILYRYWEHYKAQLGLRDFGPISQDRYAIQQFKEQRALEDIKAGRFAAAIMKCRNIWASLPGAGYGQREHNLDNLAAAYRQAGGVIV